MYSKLKRIAQQEKTTMSKIIRDGINLIFAQIDEKNNAIVIPEEDKKDERTDRK